MFMLFSSEPNSRLFEWMENLFFFNIETPNNYDVGGEIILAFFVNAQLLKSTYHNLKW